MKRSDRETKCLPKDVELNRSGHVRRRDENDLRPGWQRDEEAGLELSRLQKTQKKLSWLTVANALSVSRPILAAAGVGLMANRQHEAGLAFLAAAALTDLEGSQARWTGTDDPKIGAKMDVLADGAAATIVGIGAMATGIASVPVGLGIYAPKLVNGFNALIAEKSELNPHTDRFDKVIEVLRWLGLSLVVGNYMTNGAYETGTNAAALGIFAVGCISSCRQIMRQRKARQARKNFQSG